LAGCLFRHAGKRRNADYIHRFSGEKKGRKGEKQRKTIPRDGTNLKKKEGFRKGDVFFPPEAFFIRKGSKLGIT